MTPPGVLWPSIVVLSGGVGGARFLRGLAALLPATAITVIVNTGDDFEHWGLHVSPDLDTVMYTLAGLAHQERGWGLAEESFNALEMMRRYGADAWFQIGDRDLVTHLLRTQGLARGETLSSVTQRLCRALGVQLNVLPMTDGACRTMIETAEHGTLAFQDWFVGKRAEPRVRRVFWDGDPAPGPHVREALEAADLVLIGPSNPYVSIDPILMRPGVRAALERVKVVAISPIVAGQAVKGPLARMIFELTGRAASPAELVRHYAGLLSGIVVEHGDAPAVRQEIGSEVPVFPAFTIMRSVEDSALLARATLGFAESIAP